MDSESKRKEAEEMKRDIEHILRRVDALPVRDSRTADEILGYDENGFAPSKDLQRATEPVGPSAGEVPKAVQDFLKYRHRDWDQ